MNTRTALIITVGLILASIILGSFHFASRANRDIVKVVGYATNEFEADVIKWSFTLSATTSLDELEKGYRTINQKYTKFKQKWEELGIETTEFNQAPVSSFKQYGQ